MSNIFVKKLMEICNNNQISDLNIDLIGEDLMKDFLRHASETPDNINCFNHISYGKSSKMYSEGSFIDKYGFKLKDKDLLVSTIVYRIEELLSEKIPSKIKKSFPEINQEDWDAILRLMVIVFNSFERRVDYLDFR